MNVHLEGWTVTKESMIGILNNDEKICSGLMGWLREHILNDLLEVKIII